MRAVLWCVAAILVAACEDNPSKLDDFTKRPLGTGGDPWSAMATTSEAGSGDGGGLGGLDLEGMFERVKKSIDTPGPYESPEHSADFDADKPHWGVLGVGGEVVERESWSLTGGSSGTELRTLALRLRALAKDDKLQGLLLRVEDLSI